MTRGDRTVPVVSLITGPWVESTLGTGIRRLALSRDDVTGAHTMALYAPAHFQTDEKSHFADSDHEIFMFEGGFDFDSIHPLRQGDYLYRPAGTVYGNHERSAGGGIQIISFARTAVKFHLDDPPRPWPGQYLVDHLWNPREAQPLYIRTNELPWQPSSLGAGIAIKRLRGEPGVAAPARLGGPSRHSPWAADATFLLNIPAGYAGPAPAWDGFVLEALALSGRALLNGEPWQRGHYSFGCFTGHLSVTEDLTLYTRSFTTSPTYE
ncbi:MAG: hypothetical protein NZ518_08920 [Dehalococcoidia bacterium]|nr:hypothetical protein [Dehalococcoidia bacterium]